MSGKRHGFYARWRVGFDGDGRLQALDATLTSDGGWSLDLSEPVLARALCHIDNAYWIPNVRVNGRIAKTNKTSQTAFRGFGGPQGMLVMEDLLGRCAPLLGVDARASVSVFFPIMILMISCVIGLSAGGFGPAGCFWV